MKKLAGEALVSHHNQYPPMLGLPELRQAVARHSEREQVGGKEPGKWATLMKGSK